MDLGWSYWTGAGSSRLGQRDALEQRIDGTSGGNRGDARWLKLGSLDWAARAEAVQSSLFSSPVAGFLGIWRRCDGRFCVSRFGCRLLGVEFARPDLD